MDYKRIESELRCMVCNDLFKYPVMLPCGHNICAACTEKCLSSQAIAGATSSSSSSSSSAGSAISQTTRRLSQESLEKLHSDLGMGMMEKLELQALESDQISMVSDADSGVVCGSAGSSAGSSGVGGGSICGKRDSLLSGSERGGLFSLTCPNNQCGKVFITDDAPGKSFPANRLMMKILSKYTSTLLTGSSSNSPATTPTAGGPSIPPVCQLCETEPSKVAIVFCQQCEIFYCQACRDSFHPQRGPLTTHKLLPPDRGSAHFGKDSQQQQQQNLHNTYVCAALEQQKCPLHNHEYTMYCGPCKVPLCWRCLEKDTFHQEQHDVQSLQGLSKAKKYIRLQLSARRRHCSRSAGRRKDERTNGGVKIAAFSFQI
ncbi:putative E3 ubiquitin-protein ligase TRIM9 [Hypsibius exemplaris]|uniref:E3 ubiquitin-protein ligase TRIM9 n=1 Tax=Hypsibius exemplaris TaxID=2072580 RepID=A0A1W0XD72_HYPEX|nr:putative E3 ubiquitin-protein ligase TRIM9 [Hypsibius exemplaris]